MYPSALSMELFNKFNLAPMLAEAVSNTAANIHDSGYAAIISSGGSTKAVTRPLFEAAWTRLYDTHSPPFFDLGTEGNEFLYSRFECMDGCFGAGMLENLLALRIPDIVTLKSKRLCYLDDHADSGAKAYMVFEELSDMGFVDVTVEVFVADMDRLDRFERKPSFLSIGKDSKYLTQFYAQLGFDLREGNADLSFLDSIVQNIKKNVGNNN